MWHKFLEETDVWPLAVQSLYKWEERKRREASRWAGKLPPYYNEPELQLDYKQKVIGSILGLTLPVLSITLPHFGFWNKDDT